MIFFKTEKTAQHALVGCSVEISIKMGRTFKRLQRKGLMGLSLKWVQGGGEKRSNPLRLAQSQAPHSCSPWKIPLCDKNNTPWIWTV